jgi:ferredoxin
MAHKETAMRITVDAVRCEGHGFCEQAAPQIFELDDAGELINHYEGKDLPTELEALGLDAAVRCPVVALQVADSSGRNPL